MGIVAITLVLQVRHVTAVYFLGHVHNCTCLHFTCCPLDYHHRISWEVYFNSQAELEAVADFCHHRFYQVHFKQYPIFKWQFGIIRVMNFGVLHNWIPFIFTSIISRIKTNFWNLKQLFVQSAKSAHILNLKRLRFTCYCFDIHGVGVMQLASCCGWETRTCSKNSHQSVCYKDVQPVVEVWKFK